MKKEIDSIKLLEKIKPDGFGVIVRTAAEGVNESSLKNDIDKLISGGTKFQKTKQEQRQFLSMKNLIYQ